MDELTINGTYSIFIQQQHNTVYVDKSYIRLDKKLHTYSFGISNSDWRTLVWQNRCFTCILYSHVLVDI